MNYFVICRFDGGILLMTMTCIQFSNGYPESNISQNSFFFNLNGSFYSSLQFRLIDYKCNWTLQDYIQNINGSLFYWESSCTYNGKRKGSNLHKSIMRVSFSPHSVIK